VQAGPDEVADAILRAVPSKPDKPVLVVVISSEGTPARLIGSGVATFAFPESAARALGRAAERAEWLRRPAGTVPSLEDVDRVTARSLVAGKEGWLDPAEVRKLLEAYGIPLVPERVVGTADDAVAAADQLGYPVVVKSAAAGAHKTETGGIALDLADEDAVRAAAERIGPPVLVQPMVTGGAELLAGVVQDPVFGPLVAFGPGGVFAELIGDAAFRLAPLTDVDADELVTTGKAARLIAGWRGAPAADGGALVDLLHRLSRLGDDLDELAELDLNPVMARPDGCVVVDARVRVRPPIPVTSAKTW
jgi:acyl-CoA synthetase (NDP forming)